MEPRGTAKAISGAEMVDRQRDNLTRIEEWAKAQPKVNGVSPVQCLVYELVQVANDLTLKELASGGTG